MKKSLFYVLRHLKEIFSSNPDQDELPFGKDVIARFDKWVETKGYCRPDESMKDVSQKLGISKYELSWISTCIYGDNFLTLRKRLRIYEAARLLVEKPHLPLALIGEMVGIQDRANFRRQFEEVCGMSPQRWRESRRRE